MSVDQFTKPLTKKQRAALRIYCYYNEHGVKRTATFVELVSYDAVHGAWVIGEILKANGAPPEVYQFVKVYPLDSPEWKALERAVRAQYAERRQRKAVP